MVMRDRRARPALGGRAAIGCALAITATWAGVSGLASSRAQSPQNPPQAVFRGGTNFVPVDVYPTKDGHIVTGLTADDFDVREDDAPQRIESFQFVDFNGTPADAAGPRPTTLGEDARALGDPGRRVIVLFFTGYRTTPMGAVPARMASQHFLEQVTGPADLVGVLRPGQSPADLVLGEQPEVLADMAASYWDGMARVRIQSNPQTPAEQAVYGCLFSHGDADRMLDRWREDQLFTALEELTVRLASAREARSNVFIFSGLWPLPQPVPAPSGLVIGRPGGGGGLSEPSRCQLEYAYLAGIDFTRRFQDLMDTARRGDVAFYPVDPAGLGDLDSGIRSAGAPTLAAGEARLDILRTLAEETGGTAVVGTNRIDAALTDVAEGLSAYYLLGYYSSNTRFDGTFRKIAVSVHRPGVHVSARRGYLAPTAEMRKASEAAARGGAASPPPSAVQNALAELQRVRPDADLHLSGAVEAGSVVVVAEIARSQFERGAWTHGADVTVSVARPGGEPAGLGRAHIPPGERAAAVRVPIAEGAAGPWVAAVRLSGDAGTMSDRIDIPAPADGLLGTPLVFRAGSSARAPWQPAADFTFARTERLHVEWPEASPLDDRVARLLDRRGQPLAVAATCTERSTPDGAVASVDVALASLAPGEYVLELRASHGASHTRRLLAFRIAP
jgi:VWFA-related protein